MNGTSVSANTGASRSSWSDTEKYCRSLIGKMKQPTCADYVSTVMHNCGFYPGNIKVTASSSNLRAQLKNNGYTLVAYNNTYRKYNGIDAHTAVNFGSWISGKAKPGDILVWVTNKTVNYNTTAGEHVSIYAGVKTNVNSYGGKTTWPAHYSDPGAGKTVVCQALWTFVNTGKGSGRGYGVYIYRKPDVKTGRWEKDDTGYKYYGADDVQVVSSWRKIDNIWYYFDDQGYMVTGLQVIGGKKYYFEDSGAMITGWKLIDGEWYYFCSNGDASTGWVKDGTKWYFMNEDGIMQTGFISTDAGTYYLKSSGAMVTGWRLIDDNWYYFVKSGEMVTGHKTIDKIDYYFDDSGVLSEESSES